MKNKDITPRNEKGLGHGYWEIYWNNNELLMYKSFFNNGKLFGYMEYNLSDENNEKIFYI